MSRKHDRMKGQNLNFYLETHATTHNIYFIGLRILPRFLVHYIGVWMTLKLVFQAKFLHLLFRSFEERSRNPEFSAWFQKLIHRSMNLLPSYRNSCTLPTETCSLPLSRSLPGCNLSCCHLWRLAYLQLWYYVPIVVLIWLVVQFSCLDWINSLQDWNMSDILCWY